MKRFRGKAFENMSGRFYNTVKLAKPFDRLGHEDPSETFLMFILKQMPQTVGGVS